LIFSNSRVQKIASSILDTFYLHSEPNPFVESQDMNEVNISDSIEEKSAKSSNLLSWDNLKELIKGFKIGWKIVRFIGKNVIALFFMYLVWSTNMGNIGAYNYTTKEKYKWIIWTAEIEQYWGVFAPSPPSSFWWYTLPGTLDNGTTVELWNNAGLFTWEPNQLDWSKPEPVYQSFKNHRWFKYYENGLNSHPQHEALRLNFGRWVCREYNKRHHGNERLYNFEIWMQSEHLDLKKMDGSRKYTGKTQLWNHFCFDKPK